MLFKDFAVNEYLGSKTVTDKTGYENATFYEAQAKREVKYFIKKFEGAMLATLRNSVPTTMQLLSLQIMYYQQMVNLNGVRKKINMVNLTTEI